MCRFGGKFDCPPDDEVKTGSNIILELDMSSNIKYKKISTLQIFKSNA